MNAEIMTANDLRNGEVVFLTVNGGWSRYIGEARLAPRADDISRAGEEAQRAVANQLVVEPFFITVNTSSGLPVPLRFREQLRISGPSTQPDFTKPAFSEGA